MLVSSLEILFLLKVIAKDLMDKILEETFVENPVKIKLLLNESFEKDSKIIEDSGFIHQIEFESYNDWEKTKFIMDSEGI